MRIAVFSTRPYDRAHLDRANERAGHALVYFEPHLDAATSQLARGFEVVSAFVNDRLDAAVLRLLAEGGTRLVALRCAGFNQVDLAAAAGSASASCASPPIRRTRSPSTRSR